MAKTTEVVVTLRLEDKGAVDRLGQLEIETKQYQRELRLLNAEIAKNGAATKEQAQQVGRLSASIRSNQTVIRELKNDLSGATAAGLRFRDKMADAAKAGLGAFGLNILSVTGAITGLVSVLRNAVNTLADFDKALSSVSALGGDYAARIDEISEATKTAGIAFGFTAVESVQAVEELAKAGVAVEDILGGGLESALTLAAAGTISVADAAEVAATSMTVFGIAGSDVVRVADALTAGAIKALGGVDDLSNALKFIGPVAANLNVQLEETIGTLALFAQNGIKGEQAGTSLRGVLSSLTSPSKEAAKEMERLGIVTAEGNKLFDERTGKFLGLANLSEQLSVAMKDLTDEERSQALGRIFGNQQVTAANVLYRSGAKDVKFWTAEVTDAGIAAEVAAAKTDSLPGAIDRFNSSLANLLLKGSAVGDFFQSVVDGATDVINALSGNGFQQKEIEAFTEFVQKEYEKIGGVGDLAAESGSAVVENFRFIAEGAQSATESLDFLLARGNLVREDLKGIIEERRRLEAERDRGSNPQRNKAAIEALRIEEAAGKAALTIISEEIKKRGEASAAVVAGVKVEATGIETIAQKRERLVASLADAKAAREGLNAEDTKAIALKDAEIAAIEAQLSVIDGKEKAVKKLTAAQKEQLAIEQALSGVTGGKDVITKPDQDLGDLALNPDNFTDVDAAKAGFIALEAAQSEFRLRQLEGIVTFNDERKLLDAEFYDAKLITQEEYNARSAGITARFEDQQKQSQTQLVASAGNTFGDIAKLAKEGSAEYKALAVAQTLTNTYLGATAAFAAQQIPGDPSSLPRGIAAATFAIISGLINVAKIQGFATGGVVQGGQPIQRDNGDNVLITAKRGEVILNETQQQRLVRLYGDDLFRRAGVPGFAGGGRVGSTSYTFAKSTGLIQSPSPRDLLAVESNAIARNTNFSPVVSVVEINRLQERVRVIEQLATG